MQENLKSEESFEKFLKTLSCNGCSFFKDKDCIHENKVKNNQDKAELKEVYIQEKAFDFANNIDGVFVCEYYN